MKKMLSCFSITAFAAVMLFSIPSARASAVSSATAQGYHGTPALQDYGQEPWANPPSDWKEAQRKGFHDGIEGARKDAENNRPPNVNNRDEFRHPDVPHRDRRAYREGFRRGYQVGVEHLMQRGRHHHDHDHD